MKLFLDVWALHPPSFRLGTKLMRLVKDRGRMEQLAAGGAGQPVCRVRDVGMEEIIEDLQDKVRGLQTENEGLKKRLLVAKQQLLNSQSSRPSPYGHVQSRVNSGLKKLRDDASSPSQTRPKSTSQILMCGVDLDPELYRWIITAVPHHIKDIMWRNSALKGQKTIRPFFYMMCSFIIPNVSNQPHESTSLLKLTVRFTVASCGREKTKL